jgi:hypothetical protein
MAVPFPVQIWDRVSSFVSVEPAYHCCFFYFYCCSSNRQPLQSTLF